MRRFSWIVGGVFLLPAPAVHALDVRLATIRSGQILVVGNGADDAVIL